MSLDQNGLALPLNPHRYSCAFPALMALHEITIDITSAALAAPNVNQPTSQVPACQSAVHMCQNHKPTNDELHAQVMHHPTATVGD